MQYLRTTDHLRHGLAPTALPPGDNAFAGRLIVAYRVLDGGDLEAAALERYRELAGDPGRFQDVGE